MHILDKSWGFFGLKYQFALLIDNCLSVGKEYECSVGIVILCLLINKLICYLLSVNAFDLGFIPLIFRLKTFYNTGTGKDLKIIIINNGTADRDSLFTITFRATERLFFQYPDFDNVYFLLQR